jgi:hypothetical protein
MQGSTAFLSAFATTRIIFALIGLFTIPLVLGFYSMGGLGYLTAAALIYGLPVSTSAARTDYG